MDFGEMGFLPSAADSEPNVARKMDLGFRDFRDSRV